MMDWASIAQRCTSPSPDTQTDTHSLPSGAFVSQAPDGSSRLDTAEKDRQVNTAAILFSAHPLSSHGVVYSLPAGWAGGWHDGRGLLLFSHARLS